MASSPNELGGSAPVMRFSTGTFAPHERASAWCEAYGQTIAKLEVDPIAEGPFEAEATLRTSPGLDRLDPDREDELALPVPFG